MSESNSIVGLGDFKKQLDSLSESLNYFDPDERNKALEILQECIEECKNHFSLDEGLSEEIHSAEGNSKEKQIEDQFISENSTLYSANCLSLEKTDLTDPYEQSKIVSGIKTVKDDEYSSVEVSCEGLNISEVKTDDEASEGNLQSEESDGPRKYSLKCPKCEEEYGNKEEFLEHLQSYSGKLKSCIDCQKVFQNSLTFRFHKQLELCVKSSKVYKCKLCKKMLYGGSQYNIHLSAHKRNQCKTCGDHFSRQKHLEAHIVNVHNGSINKQSFRCHMCERKFSQRRSLVYHYKISHPGSDLVCPMCLELFDNSVELEAHQATHKQQMFICIKCNEVFSRRQQYLVHVKEHDRYKCEVCNEGFSAKKAAMKHAMQGHNVRGLEPQLQCAQCGEMFISRALLNGHMIQHTGGKTLSCEKCKMTFKRESNYRSHLETNEHLRGEEPKNLFACKECSKTFTNKNNLRVHVSRMHKANMKEHACTHCEYKTTVPNNLKRHIAMHTERPQFVCDVCGAQLQTKASLQEHHLRIHNDRKEFSCDKCGKIFSRSSDLNRHLANKHSDVPLFTCHCTNSYKSLNSLRRHQFLSHGKVDDKQKRLKKLFPLENNNPPKKKAKKVKVKAESIATINSNTDNLQLLNPQMPDVSSVMTETNTVVVVADRHPQELLQVSYSMDFAGEDKSQVVYTQNLDMSNLQVVDSMIQLDDDPSKQGTNVLINVRNLFGRNEYIIPSSIESSMVSNLDNTHNIAVASQKQDVISGLQEYIIPNDLNFLNV